MLPVVEHTIGTVASDHADVSRDFQLRSSAVGALPIVNAFLDRLEIEQRLHDTIAADPRAKLEPAAALGVLLRNIVEARAPLYALGEWVASREPTMLCRRGPAACLPGARNARGPISERESRRRRKHESKIAA